jgi:hypothetical protein
MTIEGKITTREAAESLGLSERQIIRLKKGVMYEGPAFLIHKIQAVNLCMQPLMKLRTKLLH